MPRSPSAPAPSPERAGGGPRRWLLAALGGLGVLAAAAMVWVQAPGLATAERGGPGRVLAIAAPARLDSKSAGHVARRVSAAHAAVTAVWGHDFRTRFGRVYAPPAVIHFIGRRPSACAGAAGVSGLAYCPLDRSLSLDLAFLAGLSGTLGPEGERGVTLLVARVAAEHVQAELAILGDAERARRGLAPEAAAALDRDLALQGDCLTGVWARRAARHLGVVAPGAWGRVVETVRAASPEAAEGVRLDPGAPADREEAFARGYGEGKLRDCLAPGLSGVLG